MATPTIAGTERILTGIDGTGPTDLWVVGQRRVDDQMHGVVLHRSADGVAARCRRRADAPCFTTSPCSDAAEPRSPGGRSVREGLRAGAARDSGDGMPGRSETAPAAPGPQRVRHRPGGRPSRARPGPSGSRTIHPTANTPVVLRRGDGWLDGRSPYPTRGARPALVRSRRAMPATVVVGQVIDGRASRAPSRSPRRRRRWTADPGSRRAAAGRAGGGRRSTVTPSGRSEDTSSPAAPTASRRRASTPAADRRAPRAASAVAAPTGPAVAARSRTRRACRRRSHRGSSAVAGRRSSR